MAGNDFVNLVGNFLRARLSSNDGLWETSLNEDLD